MKIILHPEGDLRKAIQRISRNSEMETNAVALMLLEDGLIRFTGTLSKELKKDKRLNRWYMKLFRKLFRRNK